LVGDFFCPASAAFVGAFFLAGDVFFGDSAAFAASTRRDFFATCLLPDVLFATVF
jgi:hypothetical protein